MKSVEKTNLISESRVGLAMADLQSSTPYQDEGLVTSLIREALVQAGLGQKNPDVPLADIIEPGMSVLLKPNWVLHYNQGGHGMDCLVTHPSFIKAALREVLAARPGKVVIGDSPIQDCVFAELVTDEFIEELKSIAGSVPLDILDFRRTVRRHESDEYTVTEDLKDKNRYILFDIEKVSLLEPISRPAGRFRITNYHPDKLTTRHHPGKHQYFLTRAPFEADVVLNLPKVKTHMKTGMTASLKNLVGINGDKDYLPHHRVGGASIGGDCYPGFAPLMRAAEYFLDQANRRINTPGYYRWIGLAHWTRRLHRLFFRSVGLEGGWSGNDTVWRMCLDLNRILLYGRQDGTLSEEPQRAIYSLADAIIAGEGNGPLSPEPVPMGVVTFSASSAFSDLAHSALMHFNWKNVALIREAFGQFAYPLVTHSPESLCVYLKGNSVSLDELSSFGRAFKSSPGWKGHIEMCRASADVEGAV